MATMIVMVLDDVTMLDEVLQVWRDQGAWSVTVLESSGAARLRGRGALDDIPLFPGLDDLLEAREIHHRTLITVVDETVDVDRFFDATEALTGHLAGPATGIMWAVPVVGVRGLHRGSRR